MSRYNSLIIKTTIMVKNFITLGDAAFDANDEPIGIIRFTPDDILDWKNIALEQLRSVKTERLSNYAKQLGYIDISGYFNTKSQVSEFDFDDFCEQAAKLFDVTLSLQTLDISAKQENTIILSFTDFSLFADIRSGKPATHEDNQPAIPLNDEICRILSLEETRVFTLQGEERTSWKDNLPPGIYYIRHGFAKYKVEIL